MKRFSFLFLFPLLAVPVHGQNLADGLRQTAADTIGIRRDSQKRNDQWRQEREKYLAALDALEKENHFLLEASQELEKKTAAVRSRVDEKEAELREMKRMDREIQPFLADLLERLERDISNQLPFLRKERRARIDRLKMLLADSTAAVSEKFRKVMEAYLVEVEYGNTVEVYQENLELDGRAILANVLRLGRVSLFCLTLDEKTAGYFDPAQEIWKPLGHGFERQIRLALEMGAKQRPADLVSLPIGRIKIP